MNQAAARGGAEDEGSAGVDAVALDVEAFRRKDPDALASFFDAYFLRVYNLGYRLLGASHDAEDLTQEVFLRALKAAESFDTSRDPWPWLVTIAVNLVRDRARKKEPRARGSDTEDQTMQRIPDAATPSPESAALNKERRGQVQNALDRLPEPQRTAVVLRDYLGYSHHELGEVLGTTPVVARKRYSRAIASMGQMLQGVEA